VVGVLDEGGQASVYRALHPTLDKELVIKLSHRSLAQDPADHDLLVAEGKLLADLDHPHLVRVYDLDFHEGRPFLVMEYVRGCNLQQHAAQTRPGPRQAAGLVAKIARALAVAHRRGVVHQDVKPRNILIDEAGQPRLIDFGMARLRHAWADHAIHPNGGTLEYMAPEQARGETDRVDRRSDLFALGGVLYALLTGKAPFTGKDLGEVLDRAGRCDFDRPALRAAGVPRRLEAICLRAMAADPADRYAGADDLAADLERFAGRGLRVAQVAAAAALVLLAVGLAVARWRPPPEPPWPDEPPVPTPYRDGQRFELKDLGSLRNGDEVHLHCDLPRGMHAALFSLDTAGTLKELTPVAVSPAGPWDRLHYPQDKEKVAELEGPPGTEFILAVARRSGRRAGQTSRACSGASPGRNCRRAPRSCSTGTGWR
jgi:serine/threonine protein kinase